MPEELKDVDSIDIGELEGIPEKAKGAGIAVIEELLRKSKKALTVSAITEKVGGSEQYTRSKLYRLVKAGKVVVRHPEGYKKAFYKIA